MNINSNFKILIENITNWTNLETRVKIIVAVSLLMFINSKIFLLNIFPIPQSVN